MFSLVRKVVAGPKRTTTYQGRQLDLTYITERVIAMAFPASDIIQKTYRNKIEDVANYLNQTHGNNYLVINVSSRPYDYSLFSKRVRDYEWPDHQAPSLTTLVRIGRQIADFLLANDQNVVAVHCNHGKGRTGTAIISFMLLVKYFKSACDCLKFYNSKRFNKNTYGVDQPCQVRYLNFLQKITSVQKIPSKLIVYRLQKVTHRGLNQNYFMRIKSTRTQQTIFDRVDFDETMKQKFNHKMLMSDIFIQLFCQNWMGDKKVARINYHLFFIDASMELTFKGREIKLSGDHSPDFQITLHMQYHCLCHLEAYQHSKCCCEAKRDIQEVHWRQMIEDVEICKKINENEVKVLLQGRVERKSKAESDKEDEKRIIPEEPKRKSYQGKPYKTNRQLKLYTLLQNTKQRKIVFYEDEKEQIIARTSTQDSNFEGIIEQQQFNTKPQTQKCPIPQIQH